jgi:Transposase
LTVEPRRYSINLALVGDCASDVPLAKIDNAAVEIDAQIYAAFVGDLKQKITAAGHRAGLSVNRELVLLYWTIGRDILGRQEREADHRDPAGAGDRSSTADVCRKHGINSVTCYNWKAKYGGLEVSEAKRLRSFGRREPPAEEASGRDDAGQCDVEGHRFKKMVTPVARREAVAHLCGVHEVSQRRACRAIGVDRTSVRYRSRRPDDGAIRTRLRELAAVRRRFGWRRRQVLLSREGVHHLPRGVLPTRRQLR